MSGSSASTSAAVDPFGSPPQPADSANAQAPASNSSAGEAPTLAAKSRGGAQSLSKSRGRDWGLPEVGPKAFPVTRPVFLRCSGDRVVLVGDEAATTGKEIRFGPRTEDAVDELVEQLWQHMKTWGIAGKGMYWRPNLVVTVEPGGVDRYADLKALLADSGLDLHERNSPPPIATKPAANRSR